MIKIFRWHEPSVQDQAPTTLRRSARRHSVDDSTLEQITPRSSLTQSLRGTVPLIQRNARRVGNKAANLEELQRIAAQNPTLRAEVPQFWAISHDTVWTHLEKHGGRQLLQAVWQADASLGQDTTRLSTKTTEDLQRLHDIVYETLVAHPIPLAAETRAAMTQGPLMVRSTGKEDSAKVTNAGGNESVSNVLPNDDAGRDAAVATVVASYFSPRSLQQRMLSNDDLRAAPFVPVLFQRMVAAPPGQAPLTAGVMFTEEPEGPTRQVSQIQAAYGHGEGVVQSLVALDTYYVRDQREVAVVHDKIDRLEPREGVGGLHRVPNDPSLRLQRALPADVVLRLHEYGRRVEAAYRTPMDIEFAYDPTQDLIYPLQARPLVLPERDKPNHLRSDLLLGLPSLHGTMISAAGGSVRVLQPDNVLIEATLARALEAYLAHPKREALRAVLVAQEAEPMSHEAITLRSKSVAVMCVPDMAQAAGFVLHNAPLVFDVGRGALVAGASLVRHGQVRPDALEDGWSKHPAPAVCSVLDVPAPTDAELIRLAAFLRAPAPPGVPARADFTTLLERLDTPLSGTRGAVLGCVLRQAGSLTRWLQRDPALAPRAALVLRAIGRAASRIYDANEPMQRSFEINWLQALLTQQTDVVSGDSLVSLLAERRQRAALQRQGLDSNDDWLLLFDQVSESALLPQVATRWRELFTQARQIPRARAQLAALVAHLQGMRMAPLWLNTVFPTIAQAHMGDVRGCVQALVDDAAGTSNQQAIEWSKKARLQATIWQQGAEGWSDPQRFTQLYGHFVPLASTLFAEAMQHLSSASLLGKIAVLEWVRQMVETYDHTIKHVTGSTQYDTDIKVQRFATLLRSFVGMQELLRQGLQAPQEDDIMDYYNQRVAAGLHERQLLPGPNFIVASARVSSAAGMACALPETLEDVFTLAHQTMLSNIGAAHAALAVRRDTLPAPVKKLIEPLLDLNVMLERGFPCSPELQGIDYAFPNLAIHINARLRVHGIGMTLHWNQTKPQLARLDGQMVGDPEVNRNERIMLALHLFGAATGISFAPGGEPSLDHAERRLHWSWSLATEGEAARKFATLWPRCLIDLSKTTFHRESFSALLQRLEDYISLDKLPPKIDAAFFERHPWYNGDLLTLHRSEWKSYTAAVLTAMFRRPPQADRVARQIQGEKKGLPPQKLAHHLAKQWFSTYLSNARRASNLEKLLTDQQMDDLQAAAAECFPGDEAFLSRVHDAIGSDF